MTDTISEYVLDTYCREAASDIMDEVAEYGGETCDKAHEWADQSEYVIYYSKAHDLCRNCNTDRGEQFIEETGGFSDGITYDKMATMIAYGEIYTRICEALADMEDEE